ncbi:Z-ring formation inhibitor MciZ [Numidum massiliense]|uniref:Z-ring formation inhibitor MciZ n=1 Tax=Numidum massiliense TaxID=1522315 RepID=UPI0009E86522|nr:Z-ring formation inhibitor MciZ [Numidum massiliense]
MNIYCEQNRLRISGKCWEIRAKLRLLAASQLTVHEWLQRQLPPDPHLRLLRDGEAR